jgi:hypothetical protein
VQEVIWLAVERFRRTLDRSEGDRNRGRRPRRRHHRAARGENEEGGMEGMGERGVPCQDGQEEEHRRRIATQGPP